MTNVPIGRRSIRLAGYDYSTAGVYFVTICASRRAMLFGEIRGARFVPNAIGAVVEKTWCELPNRFPSVALDAFVLMPNHLHGLIVLYKKKRAEINSAPTTEKPSVSLARLVQSFKSLTRMQARKQLGRANPLWQRDYYEHVVRNENALTAIQRYIHENPARWDFDRENPRLKLRPNLSAEPWEV